MIEKNKPDYLIQPGDLLYIQIITENQEINQLFNYPQVAQEFLLLLQVWSEQAKLKVTDTNPWQKLRLVKIYSTQFLTVLPKAEWESGHGLSPI